MTYDIKFSHIVAALIITYLNFSWQAIPLAWAVYCGSKTATFILQNYPYLFWALNLVFVDWYLTHLFPNFLYANRSDFKSARLLSLLTSFPGSSLAVPYLGRRSGNEPLSLTLHSLVAVGGSDDAVQVLHCNKALNFTTVMQPSRKTILNYCEQE